MLELLTQYSQIKSSLKTLRKELNEELIKDNDYAELKIDLKESAEALRSHRNKLMAEVPVLGSIKTKIDTKRGELVTVRQAIQEKVEVVDKTTGEKIQMSLNF